MPEVETKTNPITIGLPGNKDFLDTREIVARLDSEVDNDSLCHEMKEGTKQETKQETKQVTSYRESVDLLAQLGGIFSSSLVVLVTNSLLSVALFFVVIIITLWEKCPWALWAAFFGFCLLAPVILIALNVRLLIRICRPQASRFTIREY